MYHFFLVYLTLPYFTSLHGRLYSCYSACVIFGPPHTPGHSAEAGAAEDVVAAWPQPVF